MKKLFPSLFLLLFSVVLSAAQTPTPTPDADTDVVKISTNLIQLDVTVTDKNGKIVSGLTADDFEIFENDEKQTITNFSFVSSAPGFQPVVETSKNQAGVPVPPVQLRPEQVRRTIALVVDDLGLSAESIYFVKRALKKFVDEQMQPADLVAIIHTGSGTGSLQQFTSDKNLLYLAIEKIRWNPMGRAGVGTFASREPTLQEQVQANMNIPRGGDSTLMDAAVEAEKDRITAFNELREDIFAVGTLGAINYVVRGMNELPGKKSIMLFSDGFSICTDTDMKKDGGRCTRMRDALKQLTDLCNRAAVTIYTQDARGIAPTALTVQDIPASTPKSLTEGLTARTDELLDKQQGLEYLAGETGGRAILGTNDLNKGLEKLLEDTKGFYLIGYQPDAETFDSKTRRFNKLIVRVKRSDLNVRYRSGFFNIADADLRRAPQNETPLQQILKPLTSPFAANEINLKLNTIFGKDERSGSFLHSFLYIDARDLKFGDTPDGAKQATFDVLAISYGENGAIVDQVGKNYTITIKNDKYQNLLTDGFVYNFIFPLKKPGAYQMRVALRDAATAKVGSASQFIEVPDLKKETLTLSGIMLENLTEAEWQQSRNSLPATGQNQTNLIRNTSLRRFKRGTILSYSAEIYNAKLDASQKPQIQTQIRLFRDGKPILEGKPNSFKADGQNAAEKLIFAGALGLGNEMKPGDYVLQIVIIDNLAKTKRKLATQWVQFEITD